MRGKIISVFPCCGKTHAATKYYSELDCIDHDFYDWKYRSVHREKIWLKHYMTRTVQLRYKFNFIFINALPEILQCLGSGYNMGDTAVVYPRRKLKDEWVERAKSRGGVSQFPFLLEEKWDEWIDACMSWPGKCYVLESGEYLTDIIKSLYGVTISLNSMPGKKASKLSSKAGYA